MTAPIFLSVVMPAYNEEANIEAVIQEHIDVLTAEPQLVADWEIVCLDDCSSDRTAAVIEEVARRTDKVRLVRHRKNLGISQSFADVQSAARGTHVYAIGSDGQWPARNLLVMLPALESGADLVVGERLNRAAIYSPWRLAISKAFNFLPLLLFGVATRDAGSIKLGRRDIFTLSLISRSPFVEAERIIVARKTGNRVDFVPIEFLPRTSGQALGAKPSYVMGSIRDCFRVFLRQLGRRSAGTNRLRSRALPGPRSQF